MHTRIVVCVSESGTGLRLAAAASAILEQVLVVKAYRGRHAMRNVNGELKIYAIQSELRNDDVEGKW